MTEQELELVRIKARLQILEALVLELAIDPTLARPRKNIERVNVIGENRERLLARLESEANDTEKAVHRFVENQAEAALFADEFREIVQEMIRRARTFNAEGRLLKRDRPSPPR